MDNITHTLTGLMLSRAGLDRGAKGDALMIMLAANTPDLDAFGFFTNSLTYLEVHRGYLHSLVLSPLVALIPLLVVKLAVRTRITISSYLACLIGVLSHLVLDWTNVYGIRLMLPFSSRWYHLDITDVVDPIILGILILALAGAGLSTLVSSEMGAKKTSGPKRAWAWFALVGLLAYDGARWAAHARVVATIDARNYQGAPAKRVYAFPVRLSVLRWRGVVEGEGFVDEDPVDLAKDFDPESGTIDYAAAWSPAMEAARATRPFQVFERFNQVPFWRVLPLEDAVRVELIDLRFGSVLEPGFEASAIVAQDGTVMNQSFSFGRPRLRSATDGLPRDGVHPRP